MYITTRSSRAFRVASAVSRTPDIAPQNVWMKLRPELTKQGVALSGEPFLAVFLTSALDGLGSMQWYSASMRLTPGQKLASPLEEQEVGAGLYAVGVHEGGYEKLPGAWGSFAKALAASSHTMELARPCLEIYVDDPAKTEPERLRTELWVPIR